MTSTLRKTLIYAFGFDRLGFASLPKEASNNERTIRFVGYSEDVSLDEADGVVLATGIFERWVKHDGGLYAGDWSGFECDTDRMAIREKQFFHHFKAGGWTVFLVGEVANGDRNQWSGTDFGKLMLNGFFHRVADHPPDAYVTSTKDEFASYIKQFGIARTTFSLPREDVSAAVLAGAVDAMCGAVVDDRFFFLPFSLSKQDHAELERAVTLVADSALEYKRRNEIFLPPEVSAIRFTTEKAIEAEMLALEQRVLTLQSSLQSWHNYKAILCTSGTTLVGVTVSVLRDFFGLNTTSEEKFVDDAIIRDAEDNPLFVVEIKGVNGGLKRDNVNQVDSHRERLSLDQNMPGLLIINDFSDITDLAKRRTKTFDQQHLTHAGKMNVLILRTTTLLDLMLACETQSLEERRVFFLKLCKDAAPLVILPSPESSAAE